MIPSRLRPSRFTRPDTIRQLPHQHQLIDHIPPPNLIPSLMTREPTLRAHPQPPQRIPSTLTIPPRHKVRSLIHPPLHLIQILQFRKLARDDAEDHILVLRQALQRLKASGSGRVVLEVVRVHVEIPEELLGDAVVAAFGEVTAVDEVAAAEVDADVHVGGAVGDAVVVESDVVVEGLVCGSGV